jgi:hypothetical protein
MMGAIDRAFKNGRKRPGMTECAGLASPARRRGSWRSVKSYEKFAERYRTKCGARCWMSPRNERSVAAIATPLTQFGNRVRKFDPTRKVRMFSIHLGPAA